MTDLQVPKQGPEGFQWPSIPEEYKLQKKIATRVWKGYCGEKEIVVQTISFDTSSPTRVARVEHLVGNFKKYKHDSIVPCLHYFLVPSKNELWVIEDIESWEGASRLTRRYPDGLPELLIAAVLKQVLIPLVYLHSQGVVWHDFRAKNVFIKSNGQVLINTISLRSVLQEKTRDSLPFVAPELLQNSTKVETAFNADVWSLGITALELANGKPPFEVSDASTHQQVTQRILEGSPPSLREDKNWSEDFHDLLKKCFVKDPKARLSSKEILEHPFFKNAKGLDYIEAQLKDSENSDEINIVTSNVKDLKDTLNINRGEFSESNDTTITSDGNNITVRTEKKPYRSPPTSQVITPSSLPNPPLNLTNQAPTISIPLSQEMNESLYSQSVSEMDSPLDISESKTKEDTSNYNQMFLDPSKIHSPITGINRSAPTGSKENSKIPVMVKQNTWSSGLESAKTSKNEIESLKGDYVTITNGNIDINQTQTYNDTDNNYHSENTRFREIDGEIQGDFLVLEQGDDNSLDAEINIPLETHLLESDEGFVVLLRTIPSTQVSLYLQSRVLIIKGTFPPLELPNDPDFELMCEVNTTFEKKICFTADVDPNDINQMFYKESSLLKITFKKFSQKQIGSAQF